MTRLESGIPGSSKLFGLVVVKESGEEVEEEGGWCGKKTMASPPSVFCATAAARPRTSGAERVAIPVLLLLVGSPKVGGEMSLLLLSVDKAPVGMA